MTSCGQILLL
uniref:IQ motif and Sec7 domain 2 n=1 Tax=Iconisemion striatum TaxID=60296 RepID=A0A1A7Z216_9TELE